MLLFQIVVFLFFLTLFSVVMGEYMVKVFNGQKTILSPILNPAEKIIYKFLGVNPDNETDWKTYLLALILFNVIGILVLFLLQRIQYLLPFNPQKFGAVRWDTALNTAISFVTNTNWQAYGGESTMSYFTQMFGLTVQNFLSAATGIAVGVALIRGFVKQSINKIGNFWVDMTRSILYLLLPLAIIFSIVLVCNGVIQNFNPYTKAKTLQGQEQVIAQGPVASQEAIKILGTNGGGFFNASSSHPYENPTPFTDFLEILGFMIIAGGFPFMFGAMIKNRKQGWVIFASIMIVYLLGLSIAVYAELHGNPLLAKLGVKNGMNMEGKEVRFGELASVVFAHSTTSTSCGAVNSMHDSFMPLTGLVLIFNIAIGEVIFGGVGVGFVGLIFYAILTMFLVGLMIGRTPELFGKKLEPFEVIMAITGLVVPSIIQLCFSAIAISTKAGISSLNNLGPHGLSEIVYAFASGAGNNGSAFAGLNANTPFYNLTLAFSMFVCRFTTIIPALAIAGSIINKKFVPESIRFPTVSVLFVIMLVSVILIVGALTFFPVLALGPFLEHISIIAGKVF
ncbi:MAG: potassium-transporting ATPase subunit KdpA [bacterium]